MTENDSLSYKQRKAIAALMAERTILDAAGNAGVSEKTIHRWLNDPHFIAALREAEGAAISEATRRLVRLQDRAALVIETILLDANAPASVRLRAAMAVYDYLLRLRELRNVEERLTALEARFNETP